MEQVYMPQYITSILKAEESDKQETSTKQAAGRALLQNVV
jgi:hypothetical protein